MHIALLLEMAAEGMGHRVALGNLRRGQSFADFLAQARSAAVWLAAKPRKIVAFVGLNSAAFPLALYAAPLAAVAR